MFAVELRDENDETKLVNNFKIEIIKEFTRFVITSEEGGALLSKDQH